MPRGTLPGRGYRDGPSRSGGRRGWAADGLAAADDRLPDAPREGRHRLQEILEAARADEEHLGVGRDDGDVRLATAAFDEAQLAEDVALAQLGDDLALDPDGEVTGEEDVEAVRLVVLDEDGMALLECLDRAEDRETRELTRAHALDDTVHARIGLRVEPRPPL